MLIPGIISNDSNVFLGNGSCVRSNTGPSGKMDLDIDFVGRIINHEHSENCFLSRWLSQSKISWSISSIRIRVLDPKVCRDVQMSYAGHRDSLLLSGLKKMVVNWISVFWEETTKAISSSRLVSLLLRISLDTTMTLSYVSSENVRIK